MKKLLALLLALAFACLTFVSCGKEPDSFEGMTVTEILDTVVAEAGKLDTDEYGITSIEVEDVAVDTESCESVLGLTEDEFTSLVEEAVESKPFSAWFTHSVVVVRLKDGVDVEAAANKIVEGTKPNRFGCLKPSAISGAYAGNYVVFCANSEDTCNAVYQAFCNLYTTSTPVLITRENDWSSSGGLIIPGLLG